jgi:hypothetical protein
VVAGDADDEKSMEKAFAGAYGAFCVTNFWEHMSPEREIAQATANMFQFNHDFHEEFRGARSVEVSRRLNPSLQTFSQWLAQNAQRIPVG